MGSYRDSYPSGGASASAAYHYSGSLLPQRFHDPSMKHFASLPVGGSIYGYGNLVGNGDAGYTSGLFSELHSRTFHGNIGASGISHSHWIDPDRQKNFLSDSQALGSVAQASYGRSLYPVVSSSSLPSSRRRAHTYMNTPVTFVGNAQFEPQDEKGTPVLSRLSDSPAEKKRKTPSLDALIKETRELHSLFRTGLAAGSKKSKGSSNPAEDIVSGSKRGQWMPSTDKEPDVGGKWEDASLPKGSFCSSWKELDAPFEGTKETFSNNKKKDTLLLKDMEQEQYASNVQRLTCERVMKFMGDSSDDQDSDEESFADSDDDMPNVYAASSQNVKSKEEQAYEFFMQLFEESEDLQKLYNEQCHVSKFDCLVCSGIPGKPRKKYNGLISVITHASKIIKTKKKPEHRGYARAVCSVMGWDIFRLPTMPLGSSPHPRCCIPTDEDENTGVEKIAAAPEENENDETGALDNSCLSETSEENNAVEENVTQSSL